jgi:4-hydroxy-tetrahydrodipicolinate synthase
MGLDGGVNALANVVPEVFDVLLDDPHSELARQASDAIVDLFDACVEVGFATGAKTALVQRDVIDTAAVRPPLSAPTDDELDRVHSALSGALDAI